MKEALVSGVVESQVESGQSRADSAATAQEMLKAAGGRKTSCFVRQIKC